MFAIVAHLLLFFFPDGKPKAVLTAACGAVFSAVPQVEFQGSTVFGSLAAGSRQGSRWGAATAPVMVPVCSLQGGFGARAKAARAQWSGFP